MLQLTDELFFVWFARHALPTPIPDLLVANVRNYQPSSQLAGDPLKVFREKIEKIKVRTRWVS
mgnify:CR=1 FL=1